ncbi:MAG TPA: tetratricopeptide repeat protein, partial [Burkholderiaceae bacterium]
RAASAAAGAVAAGAAALLLGGCASAPADVVKSAPVDLFDDAHVGPPAEPVSPDDAFRVTPLMTAYIHDQILPLSHHGGERQALMEALYQRSKLRLEYEASMTRNASQAFEARAGNCLALVMMTGAFAKAMGLNVTYQVVSAEETWSRAGGMYFMSGHVNLTLTRPFVSQLERYDRVKDYTIDFMPAPEAATMRATPVSERTITAMYMNNRAAEAMLAGHLDDAYWRVRDAIRLDPSYISAYNTLGVIYLRRHDAARAEAALHFALAHSPDNPRVMGNYAQALHGVGRDGEAKALETRLAAIEPFPPFYFFNKAREAFALGRVAEARDLLHKEIAREPDYHEFHYWLALCDFSLGDVDAARDELTTALDDADKRSDHDLYAAKLDRLKAWQQKTSLQ